MTITKSYTFERVTLLSNTNGDSQPALTALANGSFVSMLTHGGVHLDGDIFSIDGISTAILDQLKGTGTAVDQLANGNLVVASLSGGDIFQTIRNSVTGAQVTAAKAINGGVDPQNLFVTALTGGRFAIAHDEQSTKRDVGIEVFNSDGSDAWYKLAGNFTKENEINPALAGLSNGNLAFAFQSDTDGIYVGIYDADGKTVKDRGQPGFDTVGSINRNVSMTATGHGFAIAYEDNEWDGGNDITLARFALDGTLIGKTRINDPSSNYTNPSVTMLSNGMLAVTATFANGDTDMALMLVDASNGTTVSSTTISADKSGFDNVDFSTVAGVGHGRVAAQWTNSTGKSVNGELLDVTVVSNGDDADDLFIADHLKDVIDGGGGNDTVSYANSDREVIVTINGKGLVGHATYDTLTNVENLIGSGFDDFLFGDAGANKIEGGSGKDTINGNGGADRLDGGDNDDTFIFTDHLLGDGYIKGGTGNDAIVLSGIAGSFLIDLTDPQIDSIEAVVFSAVVDGGTGEVQFVASQFGTGIVANAEFIFSGNSNGAETVRIFMEGATKLDLSKLAISGNGASDIFSVVGGDANETITGTGLADDLDGGKGNDTIMGGAAFDTIRGGDGNDVLDGGLGIDTMVGGADNDTYRVDNAGDIVIEGKDEGTADVVLSSVSYTLGKGVYVEFLQTNSTAGLAAINLVGNEFAQTIVGNAGINTLTDGGGAGDVLKGLGSNDIYRVASAATTIIEGKDEGTADVVLSSVSYTLGKGVYVEFLQTNSTAGSAAINLVGNELSQTIVGNAGINTLTDGGGVGDVLKGLGGNDIYRVASAATTIVEGKDEGTTDIVLASTSFTLGKGVYVEFLQTNSTAGTAAINLTGNELSQTIIGNAAINNLSDGGGTGDVLRGLGGNDIYRVASAATTIVEGASEGTADVVLASTSFALNKGAYVEFLQTNSTAGTGTINLTGNELAQTLVGNAGANRLDGAGGADTLTGRDGKDTFVFSTALNLGVDTITDFKAVDDTIELSKALFTALSLGTLSTSAFRANTTGLAGDASDRIIYETDTGKLFYDADGTGTGASGIHFATLAGLPTINNLDFVVG